jgi:hypothetical protein
MPSIAESIQHEISLFELNEKIGAFMSERFELWLKSYDAYHTHVMRYGCAACGQIAYDSITAEQRHKKKLKGLLAKAVDPSSRTGRFHCAAHQQPAEIMVGLKVGMPPMNWAGPFGHTAIAIQLPPEKSGNKTLPPKWRVVNVVTDGFFGDNPDGEAEYERMVRRELARLGINDPIAAARDNPQRLADAYKAVSARIVGGGRLRMQVMDDVVPDKAQAQAYMTDLGCSYFHTMRVPDSNPAMADRMILQIRERGYYALFGANCLDATVDIGRAFGATEGQLPSPTGPAAVPAVYYYQFLDMGQPKPRPGPAPSTPPTPGKPKPPAPKPPVPKPKPPAPKPPAPKPKPPAPKPPAPKPKPPAPKPPAPKPKPPAPKPPAPKPKPPAPKPPVPVPKPPAPKPPVPVPKPPAPKPPVPKPKPPAPKPPAPKPKPPAPKPPAPKPKPPAPKPPVPKPKPPAPKPPAPKPKPPAPKPPAPKPKPPAPQPPAPKPKPPAPKPPVPKPKPPAPQPPAPKPKPPAPKPPAPNPKPPAPKPPAPKPKPDPKPPVPTPKPAPAPKPSPKPK